MGLGFYSNEQVRPAKCNALRGVAAGLRGAVVGLVVAELLVGTVGAPFVGGDSVGTLGAVFFGVEFPFLGTGAVAVPAGHIFAAGIGGITGYWAFVGAGELATYARGFLALLGAFGSLLVVFHGVGWMGGNRVKQ